MHELGIMTGVVDAVEKAARDAGAEKVIKVDLSVGVMTEAVEDSLQFAFEALSEQSFLRGAKLHITMVEPRSRCNACSAEYNHDRFHIVCPECGSYDTKLIAGKELQIDSIEVDIPDDNDIQEKL